MTEQEELWELVKAPAIRHYPVTPGRWRGAYVPPGSQPGRRKIRRACDWRRCGPDAGYEIFSIEPTCPDCAAYVRALVRQGAIRR